MPAMDVQEGRRTMWTAVLAVLVIAAAAAADNRTPWMNPKPDHPSPWGLLDIDRARGSAPPWSRVRSLTGNWGGYRSWLEDDYGLFLVGSYTAEVAGNPG